MRYQAEFGDVDFITGDYLAEVNIAENAQAHAQGKHPGWEQTAWDGIEQTIELLNKKRIKVVVNGGAHNPRGLAEKVWELVCNEIASESSGSIKSTSTALKILTSNIGQVQGLQPQSCLRPGR